MENMVVALDLTDRKILHELDFNARQPISQIAKKLHLSRDIVSYRMKKFVEEHLLLKYYAIIDIARLGYAAHKQFFRFQHMNEQKEEEFISFIQNHPNVVYSASYDGAFDCVVSIWAKNITDLAVTLKEIDQKFGSYLGERQMAIIIRGEYCVRDYLTGKKTYTKRKYFFGSLPIPAKLDIIDKKILIAFGKDARISASVLANIFKLSADTIYQRIKKLEKTGILQNYNIVPDEEYYLFTHYKLLISLHNLEEKKEKQLHEYCRQQKNVWYFCTTLGLWNFEIDGDFATKEDFRGFLREIKSHFSDIFKDYTILTCYKTHKYNFCPSLP